MRRNAPHKMNVQVTRIHPTITKLHQIANCFVRICIWLVNSFKDMICFGKAKWKAVNFRYLTYQYTRNRIPHMESAATTSIQMKTKGIIKSIFTSKQKKMIERLTKSNKDQKEHNRSENQERQLSAEDCNRYMLYKVRWVVEVHKFIEIQECSTYR